MLEIREFPNAVFGNARHQVQSCGSQELRQVLIEVERPLLAGPSRKRVREHKWTRREVSFRCSRRNPGLISQFASTRSFGELDISFDAMRTFHRNTMRI